ncbi:phage upper tail fiber protein [Hyphomonas pacifica]|uniref:Minor tail protein gp31 C-terminal domain-containing protein n=1 Tax=Hyphomonas pacifica TaxID=1280941 RepID=A0A8B2PME3_9PROT|nr:hypothetical protein [Hyphomonas pacifica]RAN30621.1 hypothetical protein HY3_05585 [Hyphomonas pacifica]
MTVRVKLRRGTRAAIETAAASDQLLEGEAGLVSDEGGLMVATGTGSFSTFAPSSNIGGFARLTQAEYDALDPVDPDTIYFIVG